MSAPFWTLARVRDALGEPLAGRAPEGNAPIASISTDTRDIHPGDCFVALVGERFDAHDFLAEAVARGASALVVSRAGDDAALGVPPGPYKCPADRHARRLLQPIVRGNTSDIHGKAHRIVSRMRSVTMKGPTPR